MLNSNVFFPPLINCFVALFDVLGFKQLRQSVGTSDLYKTYHNILLTGVQHSAAGQSVKVGNQLLPKFGAHSIGYKIISDTVIFYTKDDSLSSFLRIATASRKLISYGLCGARIPLRGAIGYGDFMGGVGDIMVGSSIEDAYSGEKTQLWSGCILTNDCRSFVVQNGYIDDFKGMMKAQALKEADCNKRSTIQKVANAFVEYDVPIQSSTGYGEVSYGIRQATALDWTIDFSDSGNVAKSAFLESDCEHVCRIVENTSQFEQWALANNRCEAGDLARS